MRTAHCRLGAHPNGFLKAIEYPEGRADPDAGGPAVESEAEKSRTRKVRDRGTNYLLYWIIINISAGPDLTHPGGSCLPLPHEVATPTGIEPVHSP